MMNREKILDLDIRWMISRSHNWLAQSDWAGDNNYELWSDENQTNWVNKSRENEISWFPLSEVHIGRYWWKSVQLSVDPPL